MIWETWKKGFNAWESTTAKYFEQVIQSPLVLGPSGRLLTSVMKTKARSDEAAAKWWGVVGLPTKRDQERTLHTLNQLQSRILDLEEKIEDMSER